MSTFALDIWHQGSKCTIYTVKLDDDKYGIVDYFFQKYGSFDDENITYAVNLILQFVINEISEVHGALEFFFNRQEREATAIPYKKSKKNNLYEIDFFYDDFPLRLYCYRINDEVIVLFNGGIKSSNDAQDSPDLSVNFQEAQIYAKRIKDNLNDGTIKMVGNKIFTFDDSDEIYL